MKFSIETIEKMAELLADEIGMVMEAGEPLTQVEEGMRAALRQLGARAVRQLDQVARLRVGRVPGLAQHLDNLVVERMVGMRHADHSVIL